MAFLKTVNLSQKADGRPILQNINLSIERGEVFALIGATGAGKTTLLRLLNLIDTPASGKIYFNGQDTAQSAGSRLEIRRRMAFVLQKPVVFNRTVFDNVASGLVWRGEKKSRRCEKVSHILEEVGLFGERYRNARTLSGGEVQRVAIARAMALEPEVMLLDEPTANLDPVSSGRIEELITEVIKHYTTTFVLATHDMALGQRLADRIGVLVGGKLIQVGNSRDVFTTPGNRDIARLVGIENIIDGVITANQDRIVTIDIGGRFIEAISDYAVGRAVSACVRPEDITLALFSVSSSARNSYPGEVTWAVAMGPLTRVEIDCGFPLVVMVTRKSAEEMKLATGRKVFATFKATGVHVIRKN
jgi:tungstate transport system ATP-binding protein